MYDTRDPLSREPDDPTIPLASNYADKSPHGTRSVEKLGFFRTWFATSTDLHRSADPTEVQWGIYWLTPGSIILCLIVGIAASIGHHSFYSALHHTTVGNEQRQRWTLWIGSGLSFLSKVMLTAALGTSRTQWVWLTLRKKWLTLNGIDAVFGVTSDPTFFITPIMLKRAKVVTIMAIAMWMLPFAAILTPGTISVGSFPNTETIPCSVQSLRFPFDHNSTATILAGSDVAKDLPVINVGNWYHDYLVSAPYASTPQEVLRSFKVSAYTGTIGTVVDLTSVGSHSITTLSEKCGANCTYTVDFLGPAVTCAEFTSWSTVRWDNASQFIGSTFYFASGYLNESNYFLVGVLSNKMPLIFKCESSAARYTVQHVIEERHFRVPVISKVEPITLSGLQQKPIYPDKTYLANNSLFVTLYALMMGYGQAGTATTTEIAMTPLNTVVMNSPTRVGVEIEKMANKMVVSMLALNTLTNGTAFILDVAAIQQTNCITTKYQVLYVYSARTLILVYGLAVACALVASVAGFFALGRNGMASTQTVSAMIRTTRNRTLDECIAGGDRLGGDSMSKELKKVELRFGVLKTSKTSSFAMGVKGEISPIKRD